MKENNVVTTKTRILSFELLQNLQPEISQRFRMELDAYVAGVSGEAWKKSSGGRKVTDLKKVLSRSFEVYVRVGHR
ncbi:hypothetical protein Hdeb2414_s0007g00251691 [Helianthus debilis subsp. tardiflorus]